MARPLCVHEAYGEARRICAEPSIPLTCAEVASQLQPKRIPESDVWGDDSASLVSFVRGTSPITDTNKV